MKINEENYLSLVINNLQLLKTAFENDEISKMIFDGDDNDRIKELQDLINYLQKTN